MWYNVTDVGATATSRRRVTGPPTGVQIVGIAEAADTARQNVPVIRDVHSVKKMDIERGRECAWY